MKVFFVLLACVCTALACDTTYANTVVRSTGTWPSAEAMNASYPNWQPNEYLGWMRQNASCIYTVGINNLVSGTVYYWKVTINNSWNENYGCSGLNGPNCAFTAGSSGLQTLAFDSVSKACTSFDPSTSATSAPATSAPTSSAPTSSATTPAPTTARLTTSAPTTSAVSTSAPTTAPITSLIRYEAENAHAIQGASKIYSSSIPGTSGTGRVDFASSGRLIFTLNAPSNGVLSTNIRYTSSGTVAFRIIVNGIFQNVVSLAATSMWTTSAQNVTFRGGVNTFVLQQNGTSFAPVSIDYVTINGAIALASRGATLPYVEYEAENAVYNGTLLGPSRAFMAVASEASGRRAVQLNQQGHFVEFTLTSPANAISIRYSIPDSADGTGLSASLAVLVSGTQVLTLSLTSKFSWVYGQFPYTNNVSQGSAHRFFDEVRSLLPSTLQAGTKVRLRGLSAVTYTIDLADFHLVPPPYSRPAGYASVIDYGADSTGVNDSSTAIQNAINTASYLGQGLWIPAGTYLTSSPFYITRIIVRGAGPWYTTVMTNTAGRVGFYGNGAPNPGVDNGLFDLAIIGNTIQRIDSSIDNGIGGGWDGGSMIQNVWVEHTKTGSWFDGPFWSGLHITSLFVRNTFADGLNLHNGLSNIVVEQSSIRNTGDDAMAMWTDANADQNNLFQFNTVQLPMLANTIAVYGGTNNSATDNLLYDTVENGAGLQASNEFNSVALNGTTIFARNSLIRCGAPNDANTNHNGAIWIWAADSNITGVVQVIDSQVSDWSFTGVTFMGQNIKNVVFNNITFVGGAFSSYVVEVQGATGSASISNSAASGFLRSSIFSCTQNFVVAVANSSGLNSTFCGTF